mmetsp:Transcript_109773/g.319304  ORF Transcript_109773/g.319304 Transcript_109773/m.319304 type:complete len:163 (-) Transcript_109773:2250-2738(-)
MRQTEADVGWAYWVVVYGFASDDAAAVMTVRSFMAFGEVVESHQGTGNVMFLKYASPLQASKAVAQNPVFLTPTQMVGVSQLNEEIARRLGFFLRPDGTAEVAGPLQSPAARNASRPYEGTPSSAMRQGLQPRPYVDDTAIMRPPRRHVNCCKRVMQWVFDW